MNDFSIKMDWLTFSIKMEPKDEIVSSLFAVSVVSQMFRKYVNDEVIFEDSASNLLLSCALT